MDLSKDRMRKRMNLMDRQQEEALLREEVKRADEIRRLKRAFLDEFFERKTEFLFEYVKNLPLGNHEDLVEAHHQIKALEALKQEVNTVLETGKMATFTLKQREH